MRGLDLRVPVRRLARWAGVGCALVPLLLCLGACAPAEEGDLGLAVYSLEPCTGGGSAGVPQNARIVVRGGGTGVPCQIGGKDTICFEERGKVARWGESVSVGGVPEGDGWEVTVLAYAGAAEENETPLYYARATDVRVRKGESTEAEAILTRFGGLSCPSPEEAFPHRAFASVTATNEGPVIVAGGFTASTGTGDDAKLTSPDNGVYVYEPLRGKLRRVAELARARAGHAAVYLPRKGWVVFFGGTNELPFDLAADGFPIRYDVDDTAKAFGDFEIYDVASESMYARDCPGGACQSCCEADGTEKPGRPSQCDAAGVDCGDCCWDCDQLRGSMVRGRVLARPAVMSDGFVIITGGGDWPNHEEAGFRPADVFDANANCGFGGFQDEMVLPRSESIRAGHTMTFVEANDAGRYLFLMWGGTKETGGVPGVHPIAETYVESSQQFKGISGVFRQVRITSDDGGLVPNLYFHSMTALPDRRFLLAGGVRRSGAQGGFDAPSGDDLYVVTLSGDDAISAAVERVVGGMDTGRFLHTASAHGERHVMLFGGLGGTSGYPAAALGEARAFDIRAGAFVPLTGAAPVARFGHASLVLPDDTLFLVGGMQTAADLSGDAGLLEVYTPSVLNPLWD